jgi:peptidoglycan/xylan/chitin deacetylase (PgdA/CDA1 family)
VLAVAAVLAAGGCSGRAPKPAALGGDAAGRSGEPSAVNASPSGSLPATAPAAVAARLVFHGDERVRKVALTFDLCEVPSKPSGFDQKLVDVLIDENAPATFMMGGHWAETHAQDAKFLANVAFFEIGNHSYAHRHPTRITAEGFRREIEAAQAAITQVTGRAPRVFRFPYGEHDAVTVAKVASEGLVPVQWSVETGDPDPKVSAAAILGAVRHGTRNGSIIIMHANGRGWHSAEALPKVIAWLRGQGYELVTVSELLGTSAGQ